MLAGGLDGLYRAGLAAGHEPLIDIEIWRGANRIVEDLPISTGEVTATLTSRVTRVAALACPGSFYDVISPYTDTLLAYRGLRFAEGTEYRWPVFVGRVTDTQLTDRGECDLNGEDAAGDVLGRAFTVPESSTVGALVTSEFERLISDALPDARFGASDSYSTRVPPLTWEHDRSGALDEMATAVGSFWYALADGRFVLRRVPWTQDEPSVITFRDGEGGTVLGGSVRRDRRAVFNQVTVTGERMDGSTPVFYTATDETPTSPTYAYGPFGIRNKLLSLNTPSNQEVARGAAEDYLRRSTALTEAWTFSALPDASLELGDVLDLDIQGRHAFRQVVASISMPLMTQGSMQVTCRAQVTGSLSE